MGYYQFPLAIICPVSYLLGSFGWDQKMHLCSLLCKLDWSVVIQKDSSDRVYCILLLFFFFCVLLFITSTIHVDLAFSFYIENLV